MKRFPGTIRSSRRNCRRIPLKTGCSPRPLFITSYAYSSILKNAQALTYDSADQLTQITDKSLGQTTRYRYDLAGNRLSEQLWQKTLLDGTDAQTDVLYQDNHLAYDALNRLRVVGNDQANVSIHYDRVGNRSRIETDLFLLPGGSAPAWAAPSQNQTFTYDAMNRQTSFTAVAGTSTPADQVAGQTTTTYSYDLVGNRVGEVSAGHGDTFTFDVLSA